MKPLAWRGLCAMAVSGILVSCASTPEVEKMSDSTKQMPRPPVATVKPHEVKAPFGAVRIDPYYWLRDDSREDPEVIGYLEAENAYTDAMLATEEARREAIFKEITGRIEPHDSSVPYRQRGYWYSSGYDGREYPIFHRRADKEGATEEVLLDANVLAQGKGYFAVGDLSVSDDNRLLAWAEDAVGRRQYTLKFKNLATGEVLADEVANISPNLVWGTDNRTVYYLEKDPETLLEKRVKAHVVGTPASADTVVYEEADDTFYMSISRTRSDRYLCIALRGTVSSEMRCMDLQEPGNFFVLAPRERDFLYDADHLDGQWVIRTDWDAPNYRLMTVSDADVRGGKANWKEWIAHDPAVFISGFEIFHGFTAIGERSDGLLKVRVLPKRGEAFLVASDEPAYTMGISVNSEADTDWLRYSYTSLTTPPTTYELNVATGERRLLKTEPVIGYDASRYATERRWATARDGTKIPVSIVHRKDFVRDGTAALLQYAYGSYGISMDPRFNIAVPSLLDRGVVYAIAHIRGGQEMGRQWYEDGKLKKKQNTFTDFIDVTDFLVKEGYAAPNRVAAAGGSAGGLLMGAVANLAPEKYAAMNAGVPFVDVVTTMLDTSIPLTTNEYDEWGNPEQPEWYEVMLAYSPYDQVKAQAYPALYVDTGLWDSQVQYWEPAKWVAKLRTANAGDKPILLRTNMEAGHGGKSGRFQRYRQTAEWYAFMLGQLGVE
jgi:oligopeptidase B